MIEIELLRRVRGAIWKSVLSFFKKNRDEPSESFATISNTACILLTFRLSTKKYQRFKAENLIKILIDEDRKKRCNIYPETILNNLEFGRKRIKNRIFYLKKKTSLVDADNNNGLNFSKYTRIRKGRFSDR